MWLKDVDHVVHAGVDSQCLELLPSWELRDLEDFGPNFNLDEQALHVLVQLPMVDDLKDTANWQWILIAQQSSSYRQKVDEHASDAIRITITSRGHSSSYISNGSCIFRLAWWVLVSQ